MRPVACYQVASSISATLWKMQNNKQALDIDVMLYAFKNLRGGGGCSKFFSPKHYSKMALSVAAAVCSDYLCNKKYITHNVHC